MAHSAARSKKPVLKTVHTWIGIIAGIFLSLISLTGSVILFRAEFERAALPSGAATTAPRTGIDEAARQIARLRPHSRVRRVQMPSNSGDPYIFQIQSSGKRTERIACDASSGRVLGVIQGGFFDWMVDLHRNLLSGAAGRKVVGGVGIVLFALSATGILLWLTGARKWRSWISVRRQGSAIRFNYELHRAAGLWACAVLAVIAFTGTERAYPNTFRDAVQSLTGQAATIAGPKKVKGDLKRPLEEYVRIATRAMPDGAPIELRLPDSGKGPVDLRLYRPGDLSPSANHVYLDPASGAVLTIDRFADRPLGARLLASLAPIHYGEFGGMPVKVAWALFALSPTLLFATGLMVWWRRKSRTRQMTRREDISELTTA